MRKDMFLMKRFCVSIVWTETIGSCIHLMIKDILYILLLPKLKVKVIGTGINKLDLNQLVKSF